MDRGRAVRCGRGHGGRRPHSAGAHSPAPPRRADDHPRRQRVRRAVSHPRGEGHERRAAHAQPAPGGIRADAERTAMSAGAAAVALLATATLSFEILLVRVFAIEHFHHVAYMAIGVAMLGIGASGAVVAALGGASPCAAQRWFPVVALCTAFSLIATPALVHRVPLDLTQLAWNAEQWLRLGVVYLLL